MITKIAKNRKQKRQNFYCGTCDYTSSNSFDFNKHKMTRKHKNRIKMTINGNKISSVLKNACEICGKVYKHKSGLSRHRKKCNIIKKNIVETQGKSYHLEGNIKSQKNKKVEKKEELEEKIELLEEKLKVADLEKKLLEKDLTHKDQIIDIYKEHGNKPSSITNNNLDNCFNKNLTVNLYLNEHCKNAMNLEDFVDNIKVQLQDIMYQSEMGPVDGITNIIAKQLNDMPATERPIHCADEKRLQFYVKEEDEWNKKKADDELLNMRDTIKNKQILAMDEWENANEGYTQNPKLQDEYSKIMGGILGGYEDDKKLAKQVQKIRKNMASVCSIKKAMDEKRKELKKKESEKNGEITDEEDVIDFFND